MHASRESSDHANFNSWDRQPFQILDTAGKPTLEPEFTTIHHNFFIGNDGAVNCVDNDDGSAFYRIHDNVMYRGGHKSNFGGFSLPCRKTGSLPGRTRPAAMPSIPMISTGCTFKEFCIRIIMSWHEPMPVSICIRLSVASCPHI